MNSVENIMKWKNWKYKTDLKSCTVEEINKVLS